MRIATYLIIITNYIYSAIKIEIYHGYPLHNAVQYMYVRIAL